jgi:hypothetical protein
MPERSSLLQGTQIGVEVTSGTAVAANKQLLGTSIQPSIKVTTNTFRPYGQKFVTINPLGKEWTEGSIEGPLCYSDWSYLAASGIAYAAPVQIAATAAYTHTHTPSQTAVDTVKTYTVEVGGTVRAHKMAYGLVTSLGYTINREECNVKGTIMGQRLTDAITLTATPTAIALQPVLPTEVSVYMDTTAAGIGTTKLLRVTNIDFDFSDRFGPVWPVDAAQTSFAAHVDTESSAQLKLTLVADAVGMGLLTTLRAGSKVFLEVEAIGPVIESTETYTWRHQMCGTVSDVSEFKDEDGVYAIEWTFDATYDSTLTYAFKFTEVNTLTAL